VTQEDADKLALVLEDAANDQITYRALDSLIKGLNRVFPEAYWTLSDGAVTAHAMMVVYFGREY
jgi:hypothetical protein